MSRPRMPNTSTDIGYVPLPTVTLLSVASRLDKGMTGSIFGGRGSVLGVTADSFRDEDPDTKRLGALTILRQHTATDCY